MNVILYVFPSPHKDAGLPPPPPDRSRAGALPPPPGRSAGAPPPPSMKSRDALDYVTMHAPNEVDASPLFVCTIPTSPFDSQMSAVDVTLLPPGQIPSLWQHGAPRSSPCWGAVMTGCAPATSMLGPPAQPPPSPTLLTVVRFRYAPPSSRQSHSMHWPLR